jgi:hypothetical protein
MINYFPGGKLIVGFIYNRFSKLHVAAHVVLTKVTITTIDIIYTASNETNQESKKEQDLEEEEEEENRVTRRCTKCYEYRNTKID